MWLQDSRSQIGVENQTRWVGTGICSEGAVNLASVHLATMGLLTGVTIQLLRRPCCGVKHGNLKDPWSYQQRGS